jgi:hypothetical protein
MAMKVHLSDSSVLDVLIKDLLRGGCVPSVADDGMLDVVQPDAHDARQARIELTFFLRAWQSRHPEVEVSVA